MTLVTTAIATVLCVDMTLVTKMEKSPIVVVTAKDYASAITTITTVRSTVRVVFHMTKMH
jgi:hypothetical protein